MADLLFHDSELTSAIVAREQALTKEIGLLEEERVLNTSPDALCEYFIEKYSIEPVIIDESGIKVDYGDARVDVSHRV